jgi:hypothetical protein
MPEGRFARLRTRNALLAALASVHADLFDCATGHAPAFQHGV